MITAVITCKGRKAHLEASLDYALDTFDKVIVVDWSCPEQGGKFAEESGATVVYQHGEQYFDAARARNAGAKFVSGEYVCFLDADNLCFPGLGFELESLLTPETMILSARAADGSDVNDTVGFLACPTEAFRLVGGYDEDMWPGWGHEDLHLRAKLFLDAGLKVERVYNLGSIRHSNEMREQYRRLPIKQSAVEGFRRLVDWFAARGIDYPNGPEVAEIAFIGRYPTTV